MKQLLEYLIVTLVALLLIFAVIFNTVFDLSIQHSLMQINKNNLSHFKTCYNNVSGKPTTRIDKCLSNSLSTYPTGDAFVVNLKNMEVVWDNSTDCKTSKTMYLTKNSICKLAADPQSCERLSKKIKLGVASNGVWNFDGSPEYDSWVILPDELHNFDGTLRATNGITKQYAVVQGAQIDEYMTNFKYIKIIVNVFVGVSLFMLLILFISVRKIGECTLSKQSQCQYYNK